MKIYAIKDRLLNYYMAPFAAPDDKQVLAAISATVNNYAGLETNAINQAPHHFEVWKIGEVDDEGNICPSKDYLADCASLVRPGLRRDGIPGDSQGKTPPGRSTGPLGGVQAEALPQQPPAADTP